MPLTGSESWAYDDVMNVGWQIINNRTTNSVAMTTSHANDLAGSHTLSLIPPDESSLIRLTRLVVLARRKTSPTTFSTCKELAPTE